jgi:cbb3-type cytochrome oxidase subunit 3
MFEEIATHQDLLITDFLLAALFLTFIAIVKANIAYHRERRNMTAEQRKQADDDLGLDIW